MIRCHRCGQENPDINTYCNRCGATLMEETPVLDRFFSTPPSSEALEHAPNRFIPTFYRSFSSAIRICLKDKYATFSGRATRSEFWSFFLFDVLLMVVLEAGMIVALSCESALAPLIVLSLMLVYLVGLFLPNLSVSVRRMHDVGKSAWWLLVIFVPVIGLPFLLVFFAYDSQHFDNLYGLAPQVEK